MNNLKFWVTKCDMLEKTKLRFDREGIGFAYHQLDVNHRQVADEWSEDLNAEMPGE